MGLSKNSEEINKIVSHLKNCKVIYDLSPREISYVFSLAKAVVALDGGPMHLAWIANPKTIALFGQQDTKLWRPLNNGKIIFNNKKRFTSNLLFW
jgi:ADP-heptose:LPS heptosyltransferase